MITMIPMNSLKNWMIESANILFDDSKNDLRSLPKSVRLQILLVLSFIWTTVFSLYIFSYSSFNPRSKFFFKDLFTFSNSCFNSGFKLFF